MNTPSPLENLQNDLTASEILLCSSEELQKAYPGLTPAESLKAIATARKASNTQAQNPSPPTTTQPSPEDHDGIDRQARAIWDGFAPPAGHIGIGENTRTLLTACRRHEFKRLREFSIGFLDDLLRKSPCMLEFINSPAFALPESPHSSLATATANNAIWITYEPLLIATIQGSIWVTASTRRLQNTVRSTEGIRAFLEGKEKSIPLSDKFNTGNEAKRPKH